MSLYLEIGEANITGFASLVQYVNTVTLGWFGILVLMAIFLVILLSSRYDMIKALPAAAYTTTVVAMLFKVLGIVPDIAIIACVVLCIVAVIYPDARG